MSKAARVEAKHRFFDAQRRAQREDILARLFNRPRDLLPYDEVARVLRSYQHLQLTELREIPLDQIVGSVGRYRDFTRSFLPRKGVRADRWAGVDVLMQSPAGLQPIEVYQIGEVYFVADGNHRVSVALANGATHLEAWVTTIPVNPDIQPGDTLDEAIVKAECAHFLAQTRLAERCGGLDLRVTRPGAYPRLLEQIYAYRTLTRRAIPFPEAATEWYENVYAPVVERLTAADLVRRFPGRTPADLYVWMVEQLLALSDQGASEPAVLTKMLAARARAQLTVALRDIVERIAPLIPHQLDVAVQSEPAADVSEAEPSNERMHERDNAIEQADTDPSLT